MSTGCRYMASARAEAHRRVSACVAAKAKQGREDLRFRKTKSTKFSLSLSLPPLPPSSRSINSSNPPSNDHLYNKGERSVLLAIGETHGRCDVDPLEEQKKRVAQAELAHIPGQWFGFVRGWVFGLGSGAGRKSMHMSIENGQVPGHVLRSRCTARAQTRAHADTHSLERVSVRTRTRTQAVRTHIPFPAANIRSQAGRCTCRTRAETPSGERAGCQNSILRERRAGCSSSCRPAASRCSRFFLPARRGSPATWAAGPPAFQQVD